MHEGSPAPVGFAPEEIDTAAPTRAARLKWVVVVNADLPAGRAVNAAVCVAGATVAGVAGLLGPDAVDSAGTTHPGLPWAGCTVLLADAATLGTIRAKGRRTRAPSWPTCRPPRRRPGSTTST